MEFNYSDQDFNQLLLKCIEGSASENEMKEAWEWIGKSSENRKYYENMRDIWLSVSVAQPMSENQVDMFWQKFRNKNNINTNSVKHTNLGEPNRVLVRLLKASAIVVIAFVLGAVSNRFFFKEVPAQPQQEFYIVEAPRGAKSFVTLTDGSKIWLNAGSRISYQRNYNQDNRNIFLEGEAFFYVAKNKEVPFYVYSSGIVIKAIGTAFNVKAYPEEGIVETTLVEGSVSIESTGKSGKKEQTLMQPNQKANFYKVTQEVIVENKEKEEELETETIPIPIKAKIDRIEVKKEIDTELYTSWKDKRWVFEKQPLSEISVILERLYDVKVVFKDEELKYHRLSGSFEEENLEEVLKAIQLTVPLEFSIQHNEVIFSLNRKMKNSYQKILKSHK